MAPAEIKRFRTTVYRYYRRFGRQLPWRTSRNPYHILVSEVMLQQTQVSRVIEKYTRFIRTFPTITSLAKASLRSVLKEWQGLGYNRRALLLRKLARQVLEEFEGRLPRARGQLRRLAGIGDATAGSISVFAFDQPEVFIETNIRSVYIHHFFKDAQSVDDRQLLPYIEETLDRRRPRQWYSALMDYGVHLKSTLPNPSRKSRHHARQSRFEGSDRQIRGMIMRLLIDKSMSYRALLVRLGGRRPRAVRIIEGLMAEGLIARKNNVIMIP